MSLQTRLLWYGVESILWEDRWKLSNSACLYVVLGTRQMLEPKISAYKDL